MVAGTQCLVAPTFNHVVVVVFEDILDQQGQVVANNYVVMAWAVYIYPKR